MLMSVRQFFLLLALGLVVAFGAWWDQVHPFPVEVIRNSHQAAHR
jgi:hypothetical protein